VRVDGEWHESSLAREPELETVATMVLHRACASTAAASLVLPGDAGRREAVGHSARRRGAHGLDGTIGTLACNNTNAHLDRAVPRKLLLANLRRASPKSTRV
jgi:hypothetical protein